MVGRSWDSVESRYGAKVVAVLNELQSWAEKSRGYWNDGAALRDQLRSTGGVPQDRLEALFPQFDEKRKLFEEGVAVALDQFEDPADETKGSPIDRVRATLKHWESKRDEVKRLHSNQNTGMAEQWAALKQNSPSIVQGLDPDSESVYNNLTARMVNPCWYFRVLLYLEQVVDQSSSDPTAPALKQQVRLLWKR